VFRASRPSDAAIARFRERQRTLAFTYSPVGCTRGTAPPGFVVDHNTIELGRDDATWERARAAIRAWRMFELGWVELHDARAPVEAGTTVAVLVRSLGLHALNAARIVYTIDERDAFGFAYGTLPDHAESGEERFLVTRDAAGTVRYELTAHSRPHHWLARAASPWVRRLQRRFARDSLAAMRRAVAEQ